VLGIFRASGRFIWPLTWALMLLICLAASRWRHAWVWAGMAMAFQAVDMAPKLSELHDRFRAGVPTAAPPLQDARWRPMLQRCGHLQLLTSRVQDSSAWAPLAWQAAQAGASLYPAPTARLNASRGSEMDQLLGALAAGRQWSGEQVYVTWPGALNGVAMQDLVSASALALPGRQVLQMDGYQVITAAHCLQPAAVGA
jgi:hypothetical protein